MELVKANNPKILVIDDDDQIRGLLLEIFNEGYQNNIEAAIEALRAGVFDYVMKPLDIRHVEAAVERALKQPVLLKEKRRYKDQLEQLLTERTAEVNRLAYYDTLTGLPNRTLFEDRLEQAVTTHPDDAALVMAIVTLAHNLRLKVVAEGVETEEQLRFLHLLRCDEVQGFLFSKPLPAEELEHLLALKPGELLSHAVCRREALN